GKDMPGPPQKPPPLAEVSIGTAIKPVARIARKLAAILMVIASSCLPRSGPTLFRLIRLFQGASVYRRAPSNRRSTAAKRWVSVGSRRRARSRSLDHLVGAREQREQHSGPDPPLSNQRAGAWHKTH